MRDAYNDLRRQMPVKSIKVTRKNRKKLMRDWQRQTELCNAIRNYYRQMDIDVANWDYRRKPFSMKRFSRGYQLAILFVPYKKGSKTIQLPVALYELGYDKNGGAQLACRNDFVKRIRNLGITELRQRYPRKNTSGLGDHKAVMRAPLWLRQTVVDYWVGVYMLLAATDRDSDAPETSAAAAARARGGDSSDGDASTTTATASSASASASSASASSSSLASSVDLSSQDDGGDFGESLSYEYSSYGEYSDYGAYSDDVE